MFRYFRVTFQRGICGARAKKRKKTMSSVELGFIRWQYEFLASDVGNVCLFFTQKANCIFMLTLIQSYGSMIFIELRIRWHIGIIHLQAIEMGKWTEILSGLLSQWHENR